MADFVLDTFSGESTTVDVTNHTGETGATWTVAPGYTNVPRVAVPGDNLAPAVGGVSCVLASGDPSSAEFDVILDVTNTAQNPGVIFRASSSIENDFYYLRISGSDLKLYKVAGSFSLLSTWVGSTLGTIKIECRNASKKFFLDDVEITALESSNNDITRIGNIGVRYEIGGSVGRVDNFQGVNIESGDLPINLTGQMSFTGSLTRQVIYNRSMEGVI